MRLLALLLLFGSAISARAQLVQFEINPAFGFSSGRVATGTARSVSGNAFSSDVPGPGAFSITTALNFKMGNSNFFPSWGFRFGIYSLTVHDARPLYNDTYGISFVNFGMPVYLNYVHKINDILALRASVGAEALVEAAGNQSSFAAEGVGGIMLANRVSIGLKYYQMIGNYRGDMWSGSEFNVHAWMLDLKFRRGGW